MGPRLAVPVPRPWRERRGGHSQRRSSAEVPRSRQTYGLQLPGGTRPTSPESALEASRRAHGAAQVTPSPKPDASSPPQPADRFLESPPPRQDWRPDGQPGQSCSSLACREGSPQRRREKQRPAPPPPPVPLLVRPPSGAPGPALGMSQPWPLPLLTPHLPGPSWSLGKSEAGAGVAAPPPPAPQALLPTAQATPTLP